MMITFFIHKCIIYRHILTFVLMLVYLTLGTAEADKKKKKKEQKKNRGPRTF